MSKFKYCNASGTSGNDPPSESSWEAWWKKQRKCKVCCDCKSNQNLVGAHVHAVSTCSKGNRKQMYILLLCQSCNGKKGLQETKAHQNDPRVVIEKQKCDC